MVACWAAHSARRTSAPGQFRRCLNNSASFTGTRHSGHLAQSSPERFSAVRFARVRGGAAAAFPASGCTFFMCRRRCVTSTPHSGHATAFPSRSFDTIATGYLSLALRSRTCSRKTKPANVAELHSLLRLPVIVQVLHHEPADTRYEDDAYGAVWVPGDKLVVLTRRSSRAAHTVNVSALLTRPPP